MNSFVLLEHPVLLVSYLYVALWRMPIPWLSWFAPFCVSGRATASRGAMKAVMAVGTLGTVG